MPVPGGRCAERYQAGTPTGAETCSCGTFAVGLCQDCGAAACGDHSLLAAGQRVCMACAAARRERQADEKRAAETTAVDAVIDAIKAKPDPVERLLRISWFLDKYEGRLVCLADACPEYQEGRWDSAAVGHWFPARADALGVEPTSALQHLPAPPGRATTPYPRHVPATTRVPTALLVIPRGGHQTLDW